MSDGVDQTGNQYMAPGVMKVDTRRPAATVLNLFPTDKVPKEPEERKDVGCAGTLPVEEAHTYTHGYWFAKGMQLYKQHQTERTTQNIDWYINPADIQDLEAIVAPHRTLESSLDGDFQFLEADAGTIPLPGSSGGGGGSVRPNSGLLYPRGDRC